MKNIFLSTVVAIATLSSCSTVSSIMQNTFPYNASFVVTQGSPANTTLSAMAAGTSINQLVGASANVKDIRVANATMTVQSGNQGAGVFKSVKVYLTAGGTEILVASRDNIADNLSNSLSLDVNSTQTLDNVMKSGNALQQRIVYVLKSTPSSDLSIKTSINFSSIPVTQ